LNETNLNLRVALASNRSSVNTTGFQFKNVRIGERTRTVLVENFTNTSQVDAIKEESEFLHDDFVAGDINGVEVIKLNYHTDYPGADPINILNPSDHGARAAYYNITSIPQAVLDGDSTQTEYFSTWGEAAFGQRTLDLAEYEMIITTEIVDGLLKIDLSMTTLEGKDNDNDIILNVAIVENDVIILEVNNNEVVNSGETVVYDVVRDLLPNAAGSEIKNSDILIAYNADQPFTRSFTWTPNTEFDTEDLKVVAFLQDANTKTVYQAVSANVDPIDPNTVVTDIVDTKVAGFSLYPNPATDQATISFGKAISEEHTVKVFDRFGKLVVEKVVSLGTNQLTFDTQDYINGFYFIQIESATKVVSRKKLIIMKQ
jgi:hypothetical protein